MIGFITLLLINGCSKKTIDESDLIEKDGQMYLSDYDNPFSGDAMGLYPSGEKFYSGVYENGRLTEDYTYYNKDGSIKEPIIEENLIEKNGLKHEPNSENPYWGKIFGLYKNGEKSYDGLYKDGQLSEEYTFYYKDGRVKKPIDEETLIYRDNLGYQVNQSEPYTGKVFRSIDNGNIEKIYKNGSAEPVVVFTNIDDLKFKGSPIQKYDIEKLVLDSLFKGGDYLIWYGSGYYESSNRIDGFLSFKSSFPVNTINDVLTIKFYKNGRVKEEQNYTNCIRNINEGFKPGEKHGRWTYWYENGQQKSQKSYTNDKLNDAWARWYENGQKKEDGSYNIGSFGEKRDISYKTGKWTYWHENGQKWREESHSSSTAYLEKGEGIEVGTWVKWHENGQKAREGPYKDGKKDGNWKEWSRNGEIVGEGNFSNGTGKWTIWNYTYEGEKYKSVEGNYQDGEEDGIWTYWRDNEKNQKEREETYINGEPNGIWTYWDYNGRKEREVTYRGYGVMNGPYIKYYENGNKMEEGDYQSGSFEDKGNISFKAGKWTYWDDNGKKWREETYSSETVYTSKGEGVETGIWTYWGENEQKKWEGNYKNGKEDGLWTYWDKDGSMYKGKVIGKKEWVNRTRKSVDEDGSFLFFEYGGYRTDYERKPTLDSFENWKNGRKDGKWAEWFSNGQKDKEGTYKDGEEDGLWTYWYESGQKKKEGSYTDGIENSKWTFWYENSNKSKEGSYKDGKRDRLWTWWHENGQKSTEGTYKNGKLISRKDWKEDGSVKE
jgi:antitoxin component YwqK of YwqJK toxin-antitoxin module